jgi:hypothetical protein
MSAKPHYKKDSLLREYSQNQYFEQMISKTKSSYYVTLGQINPNLNFETPYNFKRKLQKYIEGEYSKPSRPNTANYGYKRKIFLT